MKLMQTFYDISLQYVNEKVKIEFGLKPTAPAKLPSVGFQYSTMYKFKPNVQHAPTTQINFNNLRIVSFLVSFTLLNLLK